MLRPAGLLPSLARAFDIPLGRSDLSARLGSATGRFGAYPGRTCTCENNASFRTHHVVNPNPLPASSKQGTNAADGASPWMSPMSTTPRRHLSASFWEATRIALDSLRKNKLRSFLTLLGIILATTTLIAVTALIHGMNLYIADKVSNMGADGFRVVRMAWFGPWDPKKFFEMDKRNPQLRP